MRVYKSEQGALGTVFAFALLGLLLAITAGFAVWAFSERSKYKDDVDALIAEAVAVAKQEQRAADEQEFFELEKQPYETFTGPSEFGSIRISYPKTWELYVDINSQNNTNPIKGYAHPGFVPGLQSDTAFALRFEIVSGDYAQQLKQLDNTIKAGTTTVSPYRAPNVQSVLGSRIDGKLMGTKEGNMVLIPLRDKTLRIWTESAAYTADFNEIVSQVSFIP